MAAKLVRVRSSYWWRRFKVNVLCWQTLPDTWEPDAKAALPLFDSRAHLCGILAHWFTPADSPSKSSRVCATDSTSKSSALLSCRRASRSFPQSGLNSTAASNSAHPSPTYPSCTSQTIAGNGGDETHASAERVRDPHGSLVLLLCLRWRALMSSGSVQTAKTQTFLPLSYTK